MLDRIETLGEMNAQRHQIDVAELAESAQSLKPLPQTTSQIIAVLGDPLFEISDLIKVIALDPTLTARLLRVANSASYTTARPAACVGDAIVRLGTGTIMAMALSVSAKPDPDVDLSPIGLTTEEFWRHCVASVAAAEELNSRRLARFGPGFSAAALLHDIGKLILVQHMTPERVEQMAEFRANHPGHRVIDAERAVLGVDHAEAGAVVASNWKLPEDIVGAIRNHHSPSQWENHLWNGVVLANQIALENTGHTEYTFGDSEIVADAMLALAVEDATYQAVASASRDRFDNLIELFA
ncbi:MAG: HDOD domain-containing protein [Fuerstiella sp.]|nr:HDOD domain-containing protein [Fuerstiella sp.]MCP4854171.1 HDOD domain-containing protein [Fuerstiella sp.]